MKYSILVVDDDLDREPRIKTEFEKRFSSLEYGFTWITDPRKAIATMKYDSDGIDLVFLDVLFPNSPLDGEQILGRIKEMDPDLPVIMLTRIDEPEKAFRLGKYQPSGFMSKRQFQLDTSAVQQMVEMSLQSQEFRYDREHQRLANRFAPSYDEEETSRPATVAFYLWEDEKVLEKATQLAVGQEPTLCLDVGCGTGRFEVLFAKNILRNHKNVELIGLDFSGGMLKEARKKLLSLRIDPDKEDSAIKIRRGIAEKLPFPDACFDFVILGFGIPSYTKYHLSIQEALRVLKKGGFALFSVYNDDAIYYSRSEDGSFLRDNPIAAQIDRSKRPYKLRVGNSLEIPVSTFSPKQICDTIEETHFKAGQFKIQGGQRRFESFPSLYSCLNVSSTIGTGLESDLYKCSSFNKKIYELDREFSSNCPTFGYYITVVAEKV